MNSVWSRLGQAVGSVVTAEDKLVDALNNTVVNATLATDLKKKVDGTNLSYYQSASTIPANLSAALLAAFNAETLLKV